MFLQLLRRIKCSTASNMLTRTFPKYLFLLQGFFESTPIYSNRWWHTACGLCRGLMSPGTCNWNNLLHYTMKFHLISFFDFFGLNIHLTHKHYWPWNEQNLGEDIVCICHICRVFCCTRFFWIWIHVNEILSESWTQNVPIAVAIAQRTKGLWGGEELSSLSFPTAKPYCIYIADHRLTCHWWKKSYRRCAWHHSWMFCFEAWYHGS